MLSTLLLATSLLVNGNFDSPTAGEKWNLPKGWRIVAGEGCNGSQALEWSNDDPNHYTFPVQPLRLEPFTVYRIRGKMKIVSGKNLKPRISIDFSDAKGKWLGGARANPTVDNDVKADGWVTCVGTSRALPGDTASGNFLCYLEKGSVGRVLFDDFELEKLPEEPMQKVFSSAYHDTFTEADGSVRVVASLRLNTVRRPLSAYACEFEYRTAAGAVKRVPAAALRPDAGEIVIPAAELPLGKVTVTARVSVEGKTAGEARIELVKTAEPVRRYAYLDRSGRLVVDGKRIFPIGFFTYGPTDVTVADWKGGPFNFCTQYFKLTKEDLDTWRKLGVYVATDVRSLIYGYDYSAKSPYKTRGESYAAVKARVAEIGSHPALVAWYLVDECPEKMMPNVADVNGIFHELDPNHVTYAVTDKPYDCRALTACADVLGMDPYPIGGWKRDLSICSGWPRECRAGSYDLRPMWQVPQTFNWKWYNRGTDPAIRMPTAAEMANMTWQGIAAGANGLCNYAYHSLRRNCSGETFARHWADICRIAREVRQVEPILLDEDAAAPFGEVPENLVVRAYRHDGALYVLLANRTDAAVRATLPVTQTCAAVRTLLGGGTFRPDGEKLHVEFPPCGYAFVEWSVK